MTGGCCNGTPGKSCTGPRQYNSIHDDRPRYCLSCAKINFGDNTETVKNYIDWIHCLFEENKSYPPEGIRQKGDKKYKKPIRCIMCKIMPAKGKSTHNNIIYYLCHDCHDEFNTRHGLGKAHNDITRRCDGEECNSCSRTYNWSNMSGGRYCKCCAEKMEENKPPEYGDEIYMEDKVNPKCITCGKTPPSFNWSIYLFALWCEICSFLIPKPENFGDEVVMMNVRSKKCIICNKKQPCFNYAGMKAQYCDDCKKPDMINVRDKRCEGKRCIKKSYEERPRRGRYYLEGEKDKLFCSPCVEEENIGKNKKILHTNLPECNYVENEIKCEKLAFYGDINWKRSRCAEHRKINQVRRPNCMCVDCKKKLATWGGYNFKRMRCDNCRLEFDILLSLKDCSNCGNQRILDLNNMCEECNPSFFKARVMVYQNETFKYLDQFENIKEKLLSTDKIINGGADTLVRPDRIYKLKNFLLIVEIDENNGHKHKKKSEEHTRLWKIYCAINNTANYKNNNIPIIVIRFNPENYKVNNKSVKTKFEERINILKQIILRFIDLDNQNYNPLNKITITYLYYDNYDIKLPNKYEYIDNDVQENENKIINDIYDSEQYDEDDEDTGEND